MRLPWGRRDLLGPMDGKHGVVYVECVSLMVSCYWIKVFILHDSQIDDMVKVKGHAEMCKSMVSFTRNCVQNAKERYL